MAFNLAPSFADAVDSVEGDGWRYMTSDAFKVLVGEEWVWRSMKMRDDAGVLMEVEFLKHRER